MINIFSFVWDVTKTAAQAVLITYLAFFVLYCVTELFICIFRKVGIEAERKRFSSILVMFVIIGGVGLGLILLAFVGSLSIGLFVAFVRWIGVM